MASWNMGRRASQLFFLLIFLQIPLFRIPCQTGVCTTPLQVTAAQLISGKILPLGVVKLFLFPGACVQNLMITRKSLPTWDTVLQQYNFTETSSQLVEIHRLEILTGSYFAVAGSLVSLAKPGKMSLFGILLLIWGLIREGFFGDPSKRTPVYVYPTMMLALSCAFLSIRYDVQQLQRVTVRRPETGPLGGSSKKKTR